MKKVITLLFFAIVVMNSSAVNAESTNKMAMTVASSNNALTSADVARLTNRLEEIRKMNLKSLSANQKQQLRDEVKGIQAKFKAPLSGGVYISAGALILILVILILIL